jgi:hypothetical protein
MTVGKTEVSATYLTTLQILSECRGRLGTILEVPSSDVSPETGYPDRDISWFPSVTTDKCWEITLN